MKEMQRQIAAKIVAKIKGKRSEDQTKSAEISPPESQTLILTALGRPTVVNLLADPQHMPVVELTVNGRPARFLVDTGSGVVCIFGNPQEKWGIPFEDKSDGEYIWTPERGGRWAKYIGHVESVTFGIGDGTTVRVENLHVRSPLSESEVTVATFDGLLSGAFLKAISGVIDLGGGTLRIEGRPTAPGRQSDGKKKPTEPSIEEQ